jgi:DNA-directed RNA polymerase specialized sigma24 family protein
MSAGQIATLLNVPEKSVEAVIASGKARLTAQLGL